MGNQVKEGKALEYLLGRGICKIRTNVKLTAENNIKMYERYVEELSDLQRKIYDECLPPVCEYLVEEDIGLQNCNELTLGADGRGKNGDNRDLIPLINGKYINGGISSKKNSKEVCGCRLLSNKSKKDFSEKLFGVKISLDNNLSVVYNSMESFRNDGITVFKDIPKGEKFHKIYVPVVDYLKDLFNEVGKNKSLVENLFYRIVGREPHKQVEYFKNYNILHVRNFDYTRWGENNLPNEITNIVKPYNSLNTLAIVFDNGWEFNIRVKNGNKEIRPSSIKFSITMEKCPIVSKEFGMKVIK